MKSRRALRLGRADQERINGLCILSEGLFNALGNDIIGTATIIPLFLTYLGASLQQIGMVATIQSISGVALPLLMGGVVSAVNDKRVFAMVGNGIGRAIYLLVPLGLALGLSAEGELRLFFIVLLIHYPLVSVAGLTWNYLLGDCVSPGKRGWLLGRLFALSGLLSFLASTLIKVIRAQPTLSQASQFAWIFLIGGLCLTISPLAYIPLKPRTTRGVGGGARFGVYMRALAECYRRPQFRRILYTRVFSQLSLSVNAFYFVFCQDVLSLPTDAVSNLIILQTLGMTVGGIFTGRVSQRFGSKRMLQIIEALGALVPVMGLLAMGGVAPFACSAAAVTIMGVIRSGSIGYSAILLEVVPVQHSIYAGVACNLAMLPLSFASVAIGALIARYSNAFAFVLQLVLVALASVFAATLPLNLYGNKEGQTNLDETKGERT